MQELKSKKKKKKKTLEKRGDTKKSIDDSPIDGTMNLMQGTKVFQKQSFDSLSAQISFGESYDTLCYLSVACRAHNAPSSTCGDNAHSRSDRHRVATLPLQYDIMAPHMT